MFHRTGIIIYCKIIRKYLGEKQSQVQDTLIFILFLYFLQFWIFYIIYLYVLRINLAWLPLSLFTVQSFHGYTGIGYGSHTILVILASVRCLYHNNPVQDIEERAQILLVWKFRCDTLTILSWIFHCKLIKQVVGSLHLTLSREQLVKRSVTSLFASIYTIVFNLNFGE